MSKNKNVEASIKEDEPVNIAKRGEFTEHNSAKTSSSRKYIVLIIALIAISTVVVFFYLSGQKNKDRRASGSKARNCSYSKLCCKKIRRENRNGIIAGKAGLPGNYFCASKNGFVFAIFKNGTRNL